MKAPYSVLLFLMFISCQQPQLNGAASKMTGEDSLREFVLSRVNRFSLPYNPALTDSNNLIFVYGARFDTAYFFHVRKTSYSIRCTVSEILPAYHRNMEDFEEQERESLFFDGYSFKMEEREWKRLVAQTAAILKEPEVCAKYGPGNDGPEFYFCFNNQIRMLSGFCEDSVYRNFSKYVKDSVLSRFEHRRKPFIKRTN